MQRATQGTRPIPSGRWKKFQSIKEDVEKLKNPQRQWYRLFVGTLEGGKRLYSNDELIQTAKSLGPDQLLLLLNQKISIDDPDLTQSEKPQGCGGYDWLGFKMVEFVLNNANSLLRPKDADIVLSARLYDSDPLWAIAAARLKPENAAYILKKAMTHFNQEHYYGWHNAQLAATLYELSGPSQLEYILNWYFNEPMRERMTTAHQIFIREVVKRNETQARFLLEKIITDDRFDKLNKDATIALIEAVNKWQTEPIVKNPYSYTRDEKATLKEWKELLPRSVPGWKDKANNK
jgi:hypothetical protein